MEQEIVNRVANSPLVTIDLEEIYDRAERVNYDMADNLFQGLILREKDFRDFIKAHDWSRYANKNVRIFSSADAIIPAWAYMLLVSKLTPVANFVMIGDEETFEASLFNFRFEQMDWTAFDDKPVVLKGCGNLAISGAIYGEITRRLLPRVKSLMFGEPCSTVPIYKRPRKN